MKNSDSISFYLNGQAKFQKFKDDIKYCQEVRNLLSHKKKINNSFVVEPNQQMLDFIDNLIERIKNRTRCSDIQISRKNIYWETLDGKVKKAMTTMRENLYTHVPILQDGIVIGIFDENSVFNYWADEGIVSIEEDLTFEDIKNYIRLDNREIEEFLFFGSSSYIEKLEKEFGKAFKCGKRIGMLFITATGKTSERVQGIITPWDIIAISD